jgi:hypothetical protein
MTDEQSAERFWKEMSLKVLSWHFPGETKENHTKAVSIDGVLAKIQTQNFPNMSQGCLQ